MAQSKDTVRALLERLPDDGSLDDVLYHLYVIQAVEKGLADIAQGPDHLPGHSGRRASKKMAGRTRRVIWTMSARRDRDDALEYIAQDSPVAAEQFLQVALDATQSLSFLSERGEVVP